MFLILKRNVPCDIVIYLRQSWKEQVAWFLWLPKNTSESLPPLNRCGMSGLLSASKHRDQRPSKGRVQRLACELLELKRMTFHSLR